MLNRIRKTLKTLVVTKKLGLAKTFTDYCKADYSGVLLTINCCNLKQSSPYVRWGVFFAQTIKSTIIQFQDHFGLIANVFYLLGFFHPSRCLRHLLAFMTVEQNGGRDSCCSSQREEITVCKLRFQINDLTK